MRIEQINIGSLTLLTVNGRKRETGIFKELAEGRIAVGEKGLPGDTICNTKHHGGPDQAIYLYSVEDYAWWAEELGQDVPVGIYGENFTTSGQDLSGICVGDVLSSGSVTLQISAPRIPCSTLASRMGDKQFAKKFIKAGRSGAYCRVLEKGDVQAGDEFAHRPYYGDRIPLQKFFKEAHSKLSANQLRRYLAAPIDERTRRDFTRKLAVSS
ncbi:MOSC domain-containing protein [Gammaproteobacteria bacterium]|nr:MOSC domain-containing protein [Gammaproteobacteria bacterium]